MAAAALEHEFLDLAKTRQWGIVKKLAAEHPALVNAQPGGRWTALHQAAGADHAELVAWLLARKADAGARTRSGETALDLAPSTSVRRLLEGAVAGAGAAGAAGAGAAGGGAAGAAGGGAGGSAGEAKWPAKRPSIFEILSSDDEGPAAKRLRTGGAPEAPASASASASAPPPLAAVSPPAAAAPTSASDGPRLLAPSAITRAKGPYELHTAGGSVLKGAYAFDLETRRLCDESGGAVGVFSDDAVAARPFSDASLQRSGLAAPTKPPVFDGISIVDSEIMEEIQKPSNDGAFFVLPSQLNGAEYPSHTVIIKNIEHYQWDKTGGPRGQLAVHPAAGQFVLDNAACDLRPGGINAVDLLLEQFKSSFRSSPAMLACPYDLHVRNGYLALPPCPPALQPDVLRGLRASLHAMRCLCMQDVPACGLSPSMHSAAGATHRVSLVYASAVPVKAYLNGDNPDGAFQEDVGRLVVLGQYYGALRVALRRSPPRARVFLMPLGGGVFNNRPEAIADALLSAIALLAEEGVDVRARLDVRLLTFRGKPSERQRMERLLRPEVPAAAAGGVPAEVPRREAEGWRGGSAEAAASGRPAGGRAAGGWPAGALRMEMDGRRAAAAEAPRREVEDRRAAAAEASAEVPRRPAEERPAAAMEASAEALRRPAEERPAAAVEASATPRAAGSPAGGLGDSQETVCE